jgi:dTDP-4-dehydrorhamnose 3,5-epimerase
MKLQPPLPRRRAHRTQGLRRRRGFFFESFNQRAFDEAVGHPVRFVQDNHSRSAPAACCAACTTSVRRSPGQAGACGAGRGVRRGGGPARNSPDLRPLGGRRTERATTRQFWIPPGFAHGFLVLSEAPTSSTRPPTTTRLFPPCMAGLKRLRSSWRYGW